MTHAPLPRKLVRRVRKVFTKKMANSNGEDAVAKFLGRLENIDHRRNKNPNLPTSAKRNIYDWGNRVRALKVGKNFPEVGEVAIKRQHNKRVTAKFKIKRIRQFVEEHNKKFPNSPYELRKPIAYPLGKGYILMTRAKVPTVSHIVGVQGPFDYNPKWKTIDGVKYFRSIQKNVPLKQRISIKKLKELSTLCIERSKKWLRFLDETELLLVEIKNGKPVFVPLIDLE